MSCKRPASGGIPGISALRRAAAFSQAAARILICTSEARSQGHLQKTVSLSIEQEKLSAALRKIGELGGFYFSYNSRYVPEDSLVTLRVSQATVKEALDRLVGTNLRYQEKDSYVILKPKEATERFAVVSGKIIDAESSDPIEYASVYSKTTLISTITDQEGAFRLRIREKALPVALTVSRVGYRDTVAVISTAGAHRLDLPLSPQAVELDEVVVTNDGGFQKFFSRMLVSTRLRINNLNIGRFFVGFPYQLSLSPGIGTHGRMSSQVVNKVSLNILGGYTAGVDGVEIAGGFNISTYDVRYVQVGGLFNVVNGTLTGLQVAGAHNNVADSVSGVQVAGLVNDARQSARGVQVSGLINRTGRSLKGVQIGVYNRAGYVEGLQVGVINSADSTRGLSIGLLNFIKNSPSYVSVFSTGLTPLNLAWKTGTDRLYTVLTAGAGFSPGRKIYMLGMGLGHSVSLSERWKLQCEAVQQGFYTDRLDDAPAAVGLQVLPNFRISPRLYLFAGPAVTFLYARGESSSPGFATLPGPGALRLSGRDNLWAGWSAGISFCYGGD